MYARIWYEPSGVKVTVFAPGSSNEEQARACQALLADGRIEEGATFDDVSSADMLKSLLPSDRTNRMKWRKNPLGPGVAPDVTIPDPPHPRKALLDAVNQATTINDLKAVIRQVIQ